MKTRRKNICAALVAAIAVLCLASVVQAGYKFRKTVTVDHNRVMAGGLVPPAGYGYLKEITIDNTKVSGTADLTDFPVLVNIQNNANLKTTGNGGRVTDPQGDDIVFYASDLSTRLDHEVEQYDGVTGTLVAWVRLPVLEFDVDTVFYLAYGNSGVSSSLENVPGVWDSDFRGVWHLKEATGATNMDSTQYSNDGSPSGSPAAATAGKIGRAVDFTDATDFVNIGTCGLFNNLTLEGWVYPQNLNTTIETYFRLGGGGDAIVRHDGINSQGQVHFYIRTDDVLRHLRVNGQLSNNTWIHLAGTWDGTDQKIYINGQLADSQQPGGVQNMPTQGTIGASTTGPDAIIDEVRYSDVARSADWIATEYNNQSDPAGFMTIDESIVSHADFPVLVSIQNDGDLRTIANGGRVANADGYDIGFFMDAEATEPLDHEVESYDPATGTLVAWVRLPALGSVADTVFYLHFGDSAVSSSQQNAPGVWDGNYRGVWHLAEQVTDGQTSGTHYDATGNNNNGTQAGNDDATGKIALGQYFATGDNVAIGNIIDGTGSNVTVSAWVKHNDLTQTVQRYVELGNDVVLRKDESAGSGTLDFYIITDGTLKYAQVPSALTTNGVWHYVAGTWDGTYLKVYQDGQEKKSVTPGGTLVDPIEARISHPAETMDGAIDEVRISVTARTAEWIATEYNNQNWPNKTQHPAEGFVTVGEIEADRVCDLATAAACGDSQSGSLAAAGAVDVYEVVIGEARRVSFHTEGDTNTYGYLHDANCEEIAQDDNTWDLSANPLDPKNFSIAENLAAGTYYIEVRRHDAAGSGDYTLAVDCRQDDYGDSCDEAFELECGDVFSGAIDGAGDKDYFRLLFWGTGPVTIATSGGTDTAGTLLDAACDPAASIIAADDNSGTGSNFSLTQTLAPGEYYLEVKHADALAESGAYSLQVSCEYTPVINATAEFGGTISPPGGSGGPVPVTQNGSQTFTITANEGASIKNVWVDGQWIGAVSSYTFSNVTRDHMIVATFNADMESCLDISDVPLDARLRSGPANIMFVLDDSGSMDWEFITAEDNDALFEGFKYVFDDPGDNLYGGVLPKNDNRLKWKSQWAGHNRIYYDPSENYVPWPTLSDADPDTPRSHPVHATPTFDLNGTYHTVYLTDAAPIVDNEDGAPAFVKSTAVIIDDADASFTAAGGGAGWNSGTSAEAYNSGYAYPKKAGDYTATWTPNLAQAGEYKVYARWTAEAGHLTAVPYTITHAGGSDTKYVDQQQNGGQWVLLGTYNFNAGSGDVTMSLAASAAGEFCADAVKFETTAADGWDWATDDQAYGSAGQYFWTPADGTYTATWTPTIDTAGEYEVYAWWVAAASRSTAVPYTITHAGGSATVTVDQQQNGGQWVLLGTYNFDAGTAGSVSLTYTRSGDTDTVCADAVRFLPTGSAPFDIIRAHYYVWSDSRNKPYLVVLDGAISYYEVNDADGDDVIDTGELSVAAAVPADVQSGRSYVAERQNFANWYQYYRRRELTATAAISRVIEKLQGVQVGFYAINGALVQPVLRVEVEGVDQSNNLFQALYNMVIRGRHTPLRKGLAEVGAYFESSSQMLGASPYMDADSGGTCQQSFAVVMTDGYWNAYNPRVDNADGDGTSAYDGVPYADLYAETLADVAMHYYERDLRPDLADNVPTNAYDSATHQHMVTYGVAFGVKGTLNPDDYDLENGPYPLWPHPKNSDLHKIDDLWHAAVNGRGVFMSASDPTELIDSLLTIIRNIEARIVSGASVSVNGDQLFAQIDNQTRMYQANYSSESWQGDVNAYAVDEITGQVISTPLWSASDRLQSVQPNDRIIATFDGALGIGFRYDSLSAELKAALGSDLTPDSPADQTARNILTYIRGDDSHEAQKGGTFRTRFRKLGDIVHSSPVFHEGILYAGGNDGMLHAFDAADGSELFAYVPKLVFGHLDELADPDYAHRYYVDLSPVVTDVIFNSMPKSILVGGLGKGGRGYYALDVTPAGYINSEATLANLVLWEYPNLQNRGTLSYLNKTGAGSFVVGELLTGASGASGIIDAVIEDPADPSQGRLDLVDLNGAFADAEQISGDQSTLTATTDGTLFGDPDLGYSFSMPVIVRSNDQQTDWVVIFGNGYNSKESHAVLVVLDAATGQLLRKIDTGVADCNGLSSPVAIDANDDDKVDYVYAGDLKGNMWKFDLTATDADQWKVAFLDASGNPAPLFGARAAGGIAQPITTKPDVMNHCSQEGYLVIFGTGKYLGDIDFSINTTQSVYGIWDYADAADDSEYIGTFQRASTPPFANTFLRGEVGLLQQSIIDAGVNADGESLRSMTNFSPTWATVTDEDAGQNGNPGAETCGDGLDNDADTVIDEADECTAHAGWYFDLTAGERMVADVMIRNGNALIISFIPEETPCGSGGESYINLVQACSGARLSSATLDVDGNGTVNNQDLVNIGGETEILVPASGKSVKGRLQVPVVGRLGSIDVHYFSSSTGEIKTVNTRGVKLGVYYWMQITDYQN